MCVRKIVRGECEEEGKKSMSVRISVRGRGVRMNEGECEEVSEGLVCEEGEGWVSTGMRE